jgi:hypothetical protein
MLWNDTNPSMVLRAREVQQAATKMGVDIQSIGVHVPIDLDSAFITIESGRADALLTLVDPFTREHPIALRLSGLSAFARALPPRCPSHRHGQKARYDSPIAK